MASPRADTHRSNRQGLARRVSTPLVLLAMLTALLTAPPAVAQAPDPDVAAQRMAAVPQVAVAPDATTGTISGLATAPAGFTPSSWDAWAIDPASGATVETTPVAADGTYLLTVPPGTYVVLFMGVGYRPVPETEGPGYRIWPDAYADADGTPVVVAAGQAVTGIDMALTLETVLTSSGRLEPMLDRFRVDFTVTTPAAGRYATGEVIGRLQSGEVVARTPLRTEDQGRGVLVLRTGLRAADLPRLTLEYSGDATFDHSDTTVLAPAVPALGEPVRVLDSAAPGTVCVDLDDVLWVPTDATGVMVNVTAAAPSGVGHGVVYGDTAGGGTTPRPAGSTVNFESGADVANWALVDLPANRRLCYATAGADRVRKIIDLTGFVYPGTGLVSQPSTRLLDTRGPSRVGSIAGPVAPSSTQVVQVAGRAGVPATATAVLLNVTVVGATSPGNLRVFPGSSAVPNTSVVNYAPGVDKANSTLVPLGPGGTVAFWSDTAVGTVENPVEVVLDVVGYTTPGSQVVPLAPVRVLDSRPESAVGPLLGRLNWRQTSVFTAAGQAGVPTGAAAVILNVTAVSSPAAGNLRVFSGDRWRHPDTSTLNYIEGRDVPNLVVVPLDSSPDTFLYSDSDLGTPFVVADVVGYVERR